MHYLKLFVLYKTYNQNKLFRVNNILQISFMIWEAIANNFFTQKIIKYNVKGINIINENK